MSAVYAAGKTLKTSVTKQRIKNIFLNFTRAKESRFLGYYKHKISTPVFREREAHYRETVLKPLEEIPSLSQRLAEINAPDPVLDKKVDIGFPKEKHRKVTIKDRLTRRKNIAELSDEIDLDQIQNDWMMFDGPTHLQNIADHYGIFKHLYDHGFFTPCLPLRVSYDYDEDSVSPVYMGNILQASDVVTVPHVSFKSNPEDLWSLVLTNLDGHLLDPNSEYLHWFIGNVKGGDLKSGETVCDYLRPFPMRGTGYHRLVFVLYKQNKVIDFSQLKRASPCLNLEERTFKTFDFYKEHQDFLTPAGLAFYQCTWDESLTDFFHNVLNMQEPVFEYIEKPMYYKPQVQFPHMEYFNLYLDRYRDPKEVKKEVLLKRLKTVDPFKEEPPMPKYPCLHKPDNYRFSWQRLDILKERLRQGKYRDLRPHSVYPQEDDNHKKNYKT
ncbi:large ribosomal subunit protein mL38 [Parasteatoda tepidariorum]|uniref:large ribosomal subunit protein mL38 n=1 Tax=Parasteatoda tepidariorum TaxID=114398 RepID=UPI00077FD9E1|nr:39S ribosomal protein L38, mitochondrial [Parasteatoda tepidariorum]